MHLFVAAVPSLALRYIEKRGWDCVLGTQQHCWDSCFLERKTSTRYVMNVSGRVEQGPLPGRCIINRAIDISVYVPCIYALTLPESLRPLHRIVSRENLARTRGTGAPQHCILSFLHILISSCPMENRAVDPVLFIRYDFLRKFLASYSEHHDVFPCHAYTPGQNDSPVYYSQWKFHSYTKNFMYFSLILIKFSVVTVWDSWMCVFSWPQFFSS